MPKKSGVETGPLGLCSINNCAARFLICAQYPSNGIKSPAGCGEEEADLCCAAVCGAIARLWIRRIDGRFSVPKEKMVLLIEGIHLRFYDLVGSGI